MDIVDEDLERAELDAALPRQFAADPAAAAATAVTGASADTTETGEAIERVASAGSSSSTSSAGAGAEARRADNMTRLPTQRDQPGLLERNETAMSRIHTQRSQHEGTVGEGVRSRASKRPLMPMGAGKPYPPPLPAREEYVVEFDGPDDPVHGQNWSLRKKLLTSAMLAFTTFVSVFGSSIFSAGLPQVSAHFGIGREVVTLGISFYVLGFAFGPIFWAPLSELKGRRLPIVVSTFFLAIFNFAVAVAKDVQTLMISRFFAGFFGSAPLSVVAAVFSDIFSNEARGMAVTVFAICVFTGPLMAPFIGGFIATSHLGWRWTEYLTGILASFAFVLDFLFMQETYPPVILIDKAAELRRRTKNWGIHAKQEEIEVDFRELVERNFSRPLRMLVSEPIVLLLSIYMAFIYGLLYLFLTAYPLVFQRNYHMSQGVGGLPFFGLICGQLLAGGMMILRQPSYVKKLKANNNIPVPEWRLPEVIAGGVAFSGGLFWLGWAGYTGKVHWIVPTLSGLLSGFGLMAIFLQALNYLVDSYLMFAASAIAANTFLRSLCGAAFPLFGYYMFTGMGIQWACTLLGCVAVVLVPVPVWFLLRGARLRQKSKFAPTSMFPPPKKEKEEA